MTILNWLYLKKQQLIKTQVNDAATDLILLGAQVPFTTRDDGYQDYAMTVEDFTSQLDLDRLTAGTTELVLDTNGNLTLNTGDLTIQTDPLLGDDIFIIATDRVEVRGGDKLLNANNSGGAARLLAGDGSDSDGVTNAGNGGSVRVYAGNAGTSVAGNQAFGGEVDIRGGYSTLTGTSGGDIFITPGNSASNLTGFVYITGNNIWGFDTSRGALYFPNVGLVTLPSAGSVSGARAMINDSTVPASTNFGAIAVGGGANVVPVFSDGTNWLIG